MGPALRIVFASSIFPFVLHAGTLSVTNAGEELRLVWNGDAGLAYHIDYSTNLTHWVRSETCSLGSNAPMQTAAATVTGSAAGSSGFFRLATRYQTDEEGAVHDMLTPGYYNATNNAPFRNAVDGFVYFAQKTAFHHPLQNGTNAIPLFHVSTNGMFGANKTNLRGIVVESHPAVDLYIGNQQTSVNLYAAYSGTVITARDLSKYRHAAYLARTVTNETGEVLGKLVTLYAHIDLDLDETDGLLMNGQVVQEGDLISKHLYADTTGGPHCHFEIRYYRPGETGNEEFYGFSYTEPSAGPWIYGTWDPDIGYGFGDPKNHNLEFY